MDTYAADGTFQLYNPLTRLAEGQIPGYDFPFFHGIGVLFLHFPVFYILGEHVFAAETAKYLVSPMLFLASGAMFFFAYFKNFKKAMIATAAFTMFSLCYAADTIWPENSLLGVRSTLPILVAAAMLWRSERQVKIGKYSVKYSEIAAIILLGVAVACGTEQGIAAIIAYLAVKALILYKHSKTKLEALYKLGLYALIILASTLLVMTIFTSGHPMSALRYALVDIPSDQGWYFGTPPNNYLTWNNLLPSLFDFRMRFVYIDTLLACFGTLIAVKKFKVLSYSQKRTFLFMILTGLIAFVAGAFGGYYAPYGQLVPFHRLVILIFIALSVHALFSDRLWKIKKKKFSKSSIKSYTFMLPAVGIAILLLALLANIKQYTGSAHALGIRKTLRTVQVARHMTDYEVSSTAWKGRLDTFEPLIPKGAKVWSTYTSLYNNHSLNPSNGGEDYIIHALGSQMRQSYQQQFIKDPPDFVITLKPTYFPYEEWLWSRDPIFYEHLMTSYDLIAENDSHFLWKLSQKTPAKSSPRQIIANNHGTYSIPKNTTDKIKTYTISVTYKTTSGLPFSVMSKLPRFLLDVNGSSLMRYPVSLPPNETAWSFPLSIMPDENVELSTKTDGLLPMANLEISNLQISELQVPPENTYLFLNNYCAINYAHDTRCASANFSLDSYKLDRDEMVRTFDNARKRL